jgi:hypothetical protein
MISLQALTVQVQGPSGGALSTTGPGRGRPVIDVDKNTKEITGSRQGGLEITF